MNPGTKTILALSYRANDIQTANDRRRRDQAVGETQDRPHPKAISSQRVRIAILAVIRRHVPHIA